MTYDQFRLTVDATSAPNGAGAVFERLSDDVDAVAAVTGMKDVFKLRAADVYRVLAHRAGADRGAPSAADAGRRGRAASAAPRPRSTATLGELQGRLSRCADLDSLVTAALEALDAVLGLAHSLLLLLDETGATALHHRQPRLRRGGRRFGGRRSARASSAWPRPGRRRSGSATCARWSSTAKSVRRSYEGQRRGGAGLRDAGARACPTPRAGSRFRPWRSGQVVGVLAVESLEPVAFGDADEAYLSVVASMLANAVEIERAQERAGEDDAAAVAPDAGHRRPASVAGATLVDAGAVLHGRRQHVPRRRLPHQGGGRPDPVVVARPPRPRGRVEFTNKEVRLDPVARAARVPRQPREPAHPAEAPARRARRRRSASRRPAAAGSAWSSTPPSAWSRSRPLPA